MHCAAPARRWGSLVATCAVFGCAATTPASTPSTERVALDAPLSDSVQRVPATTDLSGLWGTGSGGEPAARRLVLPVQCNSSPAVWILQQSGDTLRSWIMPARYSKGTADGPPQSSSTPTMGFVSGNRVIIRAAGARYDLRYDSTSMHLRGTLNDGAFWAVREVITRPQGCKPVP